MPILDLIRAPWKHSDPVRRAEAVRKLEEDRRDVFLSLATHDPDAGVRLAAAKRLADETDLRKALQHAVAGPARDALREKLARIVADWAVVERDVDALKASAWLDELDALGASEKVFAEISTRAPARAVRAGALTRLVHASSFLAVAVRDADDAIALEASGRLERTSHLESVAHEAKSAAARQAAKERLRALERAKGPDEASLNRAKLAILLSTAEKIVAGCADPGHGFDWAAARERLEDAVTVFEALTTSGFHATAAERAHFAANVAAFRERHAAHMEIEEARRARDAEESRARAIREEVCGAMEALFADPEPADAERVAELEARFRAAGEPEAGDPALERFRIARERLRDALRRRRERDEDAAARRNTAAKSEAERERAREDGERDAAARAAEAEREAKRREERLRRDEEKKTARREAAEALEGFAAELESIMAAADFKGAEKRLRDLRERGNAAAAFLGKGSGHVEAIGRFQAAAGRLRETLDWNQWAHKKHKEELDRAREANLAAKTALCEAAERIGELPDDDARYARILELQAQWKAAGFVPREQGDALWARFRKPLDAYFEGRRERSAAALEDDEGVQIREDICTEAESLATLDRRDAAEKVRTLQAEWHAAPPVPVHVERKLWARFRKACDKAFGS